MLTNVYVAKQGLLAEGKRGSKIATHLDSRFLACVDCQSTRGHTDTRHLFGSLFLKNRAALSVRKARPPLWKFHITASPSARACWFRSFVLRALRCLLSMQELCCAALCSQSSSFRRSKRRQELESSLTPIYLLQNDHLDHPDPFISRLAPLQVETHIASKLLPQEHHPNNSYTMVSGPQPRIFGAAVQSVDRVVSRGSSLQVQLSGLATSRNHLRCSIQWPCDRAAIAHELIGSQAWDQSAWSD